LIAGYAKHEDFCVSPTTRSRLNSRDGVGGGAAVIVVVFHCLCISLPDLATQSSAIPQALSETHPISVVALIAGMALSFGLEAIPGRLLFALCLVPVALFFSVIAHWRLTDEVPQVVLIAASAIKTLAPSHLFTVMVDEPATKLLRRIRTLWG
jgi:uncharacterized membrane protein